MNSQKYEFYDPHPGLAGAVIPIPEPVRKVANELVGQTMTLQEALEKIKAVTDGNVSVVERHNFIGLEIEEAETNRRHSFRVIRFK